MKRLQVLTGCCIVLFLVLTSVSAIKKKLSTIDDLKQLNFDQSVPKHSLLLLYWFANTVDIDNNDLIRLTFDPNCEDYGSHHYGNYERLLEPLPHGNVRYRYYTVGNLNQEMTSLQLPSYVIHPRVGFEGRNRDRIIFRVREQNAGRQSEPIIDQVYITQHYAQTDNQGTKYDPEHTYRVTPNLLRQIRQFPDENYRDVRENLRYLRDYFNSHADENQLNYIENTWGELACLGLFLYIIIHEKHSSRQPNRRQQPSTRQKKNSDFVVNIPASTRRSISGNFVSLNLANQRNNMTLNVKTSTSGTAMIHWSNVPENYLNDGVMVALYKSNDDEKALFQKSIENKRSGSYDTKIPLNEQLQARLHKSQTLCFFWKTLREEIDRGQEFKNPSAVYISGYDAKLQLFVENGKACVRLYVSKYVDWNSTFKKSWVGFYSSETKHTQNYEWWQWQWVTKFTPKMNFQDFTYDIFEYQSNLTIAPGVQARLMLQEFEEKARTPGWK